MKTTVKGAEELVRKLQTLRKVVAKKAIRKGSLAGCKIVQAQAKQNVPVRTGALKRQVKVRAIKRSRRWTGTQVTTKIADGPAFYAGFVLEGTKHIKARKSIEKAFAQTKGAAENAFVEGIRAEIETL